VSYYNYIRAYNEKNCKLYVSYYNYIRSYNENKCKLYVPYYNYIRVYNEKNCKLYVSYYNYIRSYTQNIKNFLSSNGQVVLINSNAATWTWYKVINILHTLQKFYDLDN
jgi:hypothetical protein